jgi:hypothetical protein
MSFEELARQIRAEEIGRRQKSERVPAVRQPVGPLPKGGVQCLQLATVTGGSAGRHITSGKSAVYQETAATLRTAAAMLRRRDPRLSSYPNRALKLSLRDRGHTMRGGPIGRIASAAVLRQVRRHHPGWPQTGCLIRLAAEDGVPALQEVLLSAAGWCANQGTTEG